MKQLSSLLKISVSSILIFFSLSASGGNPYRSPAGAAEAGMGYVCIMKPGFWSSFHNQANLPFSNSFYCGFNYENRFNIPELGTRTAGLIVPAGSVTLAGIYSHFGYSDFSRQMAGVASGMKLSEKISAGIQIDYFSEKSPGEINNQIITYETGLLVTANENTTIGIHIFNLVPGSIRKTYMPSSIRIGAGTYLNKSLFAGAEVEMSSGGNLLIRTGFEYEAVKNLWLRGGYSSENNSFSFGFGFMVKMMQLDLGVATHERLGVTSSMSLIFKIR